MQAVAVGCYVIMTIKEGTYTDMNRKGGGFQKNLISKVWFKQLFKE